MEQFAAWLSSHLLPCAYKQLFGVCCPLCGCQRGLLLLLQGDVAGALFRFPLFAVWGTSMIVYLLLLVFRRATPMRLRWLLYANLVLLLLNAVYQNVVG